MGMFDWLGAAPGGGSGGGGGYGGGNQVSNGSILAAMLQDIGASYNNRAPTAIASMQQKLQQDGEYQSAIKGMMGTPQFNPVQVTPQVQQPQMAPGGPQMPNAPGATPLSDPSRLATAQSPIQSYSGPVGQAMGFDQASAMAPLLQGLDPSLGMPLLLQSTQAAMDRKQKLADAKITPLSDADAQARGLRPGGVYGTDASGNIQTIQASDMKSAGAMHQGLQQSEDLAKFNNGLPMTAAQSAANNLGYAQLNKPVSLGLGNTLVDPRTGKQIGGGDAPGGPISPDLSTYPAPVQGMVKAMLEGRQAPPSSTALRTPYWQNLLTIANTVDPTFDQTNWGGRASANKDFLGGGKSYQMLNSGNTAIQHLGRLYDQIPSVSGMQVPLVGNALNSVMNAGSQASGTPGVNAYNDTLGHLAEETTKFYRGTGGSESDVSRNMGNLAPNLSTAQKQAGVKNTVDLIYGKLAPMVEQYNKTMGKNYPVSHFLSQPTIATIKKIGFDPDTGQPVSAPNAAPSAHAGVTQSKVINGVTYHQVNGKWMQE